MIHNPDTRFIAYKHTTTYPDFFDLLSNFVSDNL